MKCFSLPFHFPSARALFCKTRTCGRRDSLHLFVHGSFFQCCSTTKEMESIQVINIGLIDKSNVTLVLYSILLLTGYVKCFSSCSFSATKHLLPRGHRLSSLQINKINTVLLYNRIPNSVPQVSLLPFVQVNVTNA